MLPIHVIIIDGEEIEEVGAYDYDNQISPSSPTGMSAPTVVPSPTTVSTYDELDGFLVLELIVRRADGNIVYERWRWVAF